MDSNTTLTEHDLGKTFKITLKGTDKITTTGKLKVFDKYNGIVFIELKNSKHSLTTPIELSNIQKAEEEKQSKGGKTKKTNKKKNKKYNKSYKKHKK
jgi:hypothetical protein